MRRLFISVGLLAMAGACGESAPNASTAAPPPAMTMTQPDPGAVAADWQSTPSGLRYRRISGDGTGPKPSPTDVVTLHYVGRLTDGTEFDSSLRSGEPVTMALPSLIRGWQEGVPLMSVGDVYEFLIPPELGYGEAGGGPIPPGATLHFTIGLLGIGG